jgi:replicative DNA helicase
MDALAKRKEIESVGGVAYLAFLTEGLPRRPNIEEYVRIVKDKSLLRQLMASAQRGPWPAPPTRPKTPRAIQRGFSSIPEIVASSFGSIDALYEQGREVTGLATHYIEFDKMTSGLQNSELIIIAARPSMGKTAWAINIAQNCAVKDRQSRRRLLARNVQGIPPPTHARLRSHGRLAASSKPASSPAKTRASSSPRSTAS